MRLPWQRERFRIDLDPIQVTLMRFLLRFGPAPAAKLFDEVTVTHGAEVADFRSALAGLVEKELIESKPQQDAEPWFELTALGKRLRGKVPNVRTGLAVYV